MSKKIALLGAGSWGTALARLLANKGEEVILWARRPELAEEINEQRQNSRYLPGVILPEGIRATVDIQSVLFNADVVIFSVPSHAFREVLSQASPYLPPQALIVNVAKGLEEDTLMRLSQVFIEEAGNQKAQRYAILSGPSHAEEVGREVPTAVVVAGFHLKTAELVQDLFMTVNFRVYTSHDVTGVELGGALKNIIALGTGIADGLGYGDNTKAALMTRGLAEITRLGVAQGANPLTFIGLAGVGDLIVTCTSMHSRNRRAGIEIGRGKSLSEAVARVNMVVEGIRTTRAASHLADRCNVEMPITRYIYRVLFEGLSPRAAVLALMTRDRKSEIEDLTSPTALLPGNFADNSYH